MPFFYHIERDDRHIGDKSHGSLFGIGVGDAGGGFGVINREHNFSSAFDGQCVLDGFSSHHFIFAGLSCVT